MLILVIFGIVFWGVLLRDSYWCIWNEVNQHGKSLLGTWNPHHFIRQGFFWPGSTSCTGLGSSHSLSSPSLNWRAASCCPHPEVIAALVAPCPGVVFFDFWGFVLVCSIVMVSTNLHRPWVKINTCFIASWNLFPCLCHQLGTTGCG